MIPMQYIHKPNIYRALLKQMRRSREFSATEKGGSGCVRSMASSRAEPKQEERGKKPDR